MSIEIQCMTEKLIVTGITIKLDYSKVPSKSTMPTYANNNILINASHFLLFLLKQAYLLYHKFLFFEKQIIFHFL